MFCANCGKQFLDGAAFCGNCGAAVRKIENQAAEAVQPETETQPVETVQDAEILAANEPAAVEAPVTQTVETEAPVDELVIKEAFNNGNPEAADAEASQVNEPMIEMQNEPAAETQDESAADAQVHPQSSGYVFENQLNAVNIGHGTTAPPVAPRKRMNKAVKVLISCAAVIVLLTGAAFAFEGPITHNIISDKAFFAKLNNFDLGLSGLTNNMSEYKSGSMKMSAKIGDALSETAGKEVADILSRSEYGCKIGYTEDGKIAVDFGVFLNSDGLVSVRMLISHDALRLSIPQLSDNVFELKRGDSAELEQLFEFFDTLLNANNVEQNQISGAEFEALIMDSYNKALRNINKSCFTNDKYSFSNITKGNRSEDGHSAVILTLTEKDFIDFVKDFLSSVRDHDNFSKILKAYDTDMRKTVENTLNETIKTLENYKGSGSSEVLKFKTVYSGRGYITGKAFAWEIEVPGGMSMLIVTDKDSWAVFANDMKVIECTRETEGNTINAVVNIYNLGFSMDDPSKPMMTVSAKYEKDSSSAFLLPFGEYEVSYSQTSAVFEDGGYNYELKTVNYDIKLKIDKAGDGAEKIVFSISEEKKLLAEFTVEISRSKDYFDVKNLEQNGKTVYNMEEFFEDIKEKLPALFEKFGMNFEDLMNGMGDFMGTNNQTPVDLDPKNPDDIYLTPDEPDFDRDDEF